MGLKCLIASLSARPEAAATEHTTEALSFNFFKTVWQSIAQHRLLVKLQIFDQQQILIMEHGYLVIDVYKRRSVECYDKSQKLQVEFFCLHSGPHPLGTMLMIASAQVTISLIFFFKLIFNLQEKDDNLYDLVDEDQYSDIVRQRREDDWIVGGNSQLIISTL